MRMEDVVRLQLGEDIPTTGSGVMVGPVKPSEQVLEHLATQNRFREFKAKLIKWAPYLLGGIALLVIAPKLLKKKPAAAMGCGGSSRRRRR